MRLQPGGHQPDDPRAGDAFYWTLGQVFDAHSFLRFTASTGGLIGPSVSRLVLVGVVTTLVGAAPDCAIAQAKKPEAAKGERALQWGPAPDAFPAGAKMAVEKGDPTKSGGFVVRLSFPADYKIPPHWHPTAEHVRVVANQRLWRDPAIDST